MEEASEELIRHGIQAAECAVHFFEEYLAVREKRLKEGYYDEMDGHC